MPAKTSQEIHHILPHFFHRKDEKIRTKQAVKPTKVEQVKQTALETAKSKPKPLKKSQTSRPIERVLYGVGKAVTYLPEKQEQWLYKTVYEKYIFPKLTPEQKKRAQEMEPKIKKAAKIGGWVMTGAEVYIAAVIVRSLYRKVKARRAPQDFQVVVDIPSNTSLQADTSPTHLADTPPVTKPSSVAAPVPLKVEQVKSEPIIGGLPSYLRTTLDGLGEKFSQGLAGKMSPEEITASVKLFQERFGLMLSYGIPDHVAQAFAQIKGLREEDQVREVAIRGLIDWMKWIQDKGETPLTMVELLPLTQALGIVGFDVLAQLDPRKLKGMNPAHIATALAKAFGATEIVGNMVINTASQGARLAYDALKTTTIQNEILEHFGEQAEKSLEAAIAAGFGYFLTHGIVSKINAAPNREKQREAFQSAWMDFVSQTTDKASLQEILEREPSDDEVFGTFMNLAAMHMVHETLGYPGADAIGIEWKDN